ASKRLHKTSFCRASAHDLSWRFHALGRSSSWRESGSRRFAPRRFGTRPLRSGEARPGRGRHPRFRAPSLRCAFAVVAAAKDAKLTLRISAILRAVTATKAGSHFFPRCGDGARYGLSVSTRIRSDGAQAATSWTLFAVLKVTMPEKERSK